MSSSLSELIATHAAACPPARQDRLRHWLAPVVHLAGPILECDPTPRKDFVKCIVDMVRTMDVDQSPEKMLTEDGHKLKAYLWAIKALQSQQLSIPLRPVRPSHKVIVHSPDMLYAQLIKMDRSGAIPLHLLRGQDLPDYVVEVLGDDINTFDDSSQFAADIIDPIERDLLAGAAPAATISRTAINSSWCA